MPRIRVRQHVNPLSKKYLTPITPPHWEKVYNQHKQPLHLDIGSAKGEFLLEMATLQPDWNFLGLEIREPLVEQAQESVAELGLSNVHFIFCNVDNSLVPILDSLPQGVLKRVTIQFPDPWFKKRHEKRRVVKPELVNTLAKYLKEGGETLIQSDVETVAKEMRDRFTENPAFQPQGKDWLVTNPLPVPTERETYTISCGQPVYRALFSRKCRGVGA
ncbi:MAG: tRNA (guanosine(46)-N7)-methyltransferase TrmB [Coleofasciculus sp. G3-WIS-01]|uniref:tRNA (guanosine(46)-N7)-methyltransferase TrmB n=1 Tax=Coleofasciculus sp. G3-WIS-01 TaxID=3069528 RepID=UPI0032F87400